MTLATLRITADADLYTPPSLLRMFTSHMQHAKWAVIAETGRSFFRESPEAFNRSVLHFIARY